MSIFMHRQVPHLSAEALAQKPLLAIFSWSEWETIQARGREIKKYFDEKQKAGGGPKKWGNVDSVETDWEKSPWTEDELLKQGTFLVDGPAVVAFVDRAGVRTIAAAHFSVPAGASLDRAAGDFYCIPDKKLVFSYGACVVAHRGATGSGNMHMVGCNPSAKKPKTGEAVGRYGANNKKCGELLEASRNFGEEFAALEKKYAPAAAVSRLRVMQEADPGGKSSLVEGYPHVLFNGGHVISRTRGFVIAPHDDSSASGALETVFFWKPTTTILTRAGCSDAELKPGHKWLFYAGVIFCLPTTPGEGSMVLVSCSGEPHTRTVHGTLPSSSTEPHQVHGGLGSALVTKQRFISQCKKRDAAAAGAAGGVEKPVKKHRGASS